MAENKSGTKKVKSPLLRGEGSMKNVTIMATIYDNSVCEPKELENGKMSQAGAFVKNELARFDNSNEKVGPQFDPALRRETVTDDKGQTWNNKSLFYAESSVDKMREASGGNTQTIYRHVDGEPTDERIGEILVFDSNLGYAKDGSMYCIPDSIKPTEVTVPENVQSAQYEAVTAERTELRAKLAAKEAAKASEKQAEAPAKSNDSPEF